MACQATQDVQRPNYCVSYLNNVVLHAPCFVYHAVNYLGLGHIDTFSKTRGPSDCWTCHQLDKCGVKKRFRELGPICFEVGLLLIFVWWPLWDLLEKCTPFVDVFSLP